MSNLIPFLEHLAVIPQKDALTRQQLSALCEQYQLDPLQIEAIAHQDLVRLQQLAMVGKGGCFVIVTPDEPDDDPQDQDDTEPSSTHYQA